MSRPERTEHEKLTIELMKRYFFSERISFEEDLQFLDKPDWVFEISEGRRIACELSLISRQEIFEWYKQPQKMDYETQWVLTYPVEPHSWLTKILTKKNKKVDEYLKLSKADEAWLLVHSPNIKNDNVLSVDYVSRKLMKYAASNNENQFDEIWVCHNTNGVYRIWKKGDKKLRKPKLDFSKGYPRRDIRTTKIRIKTGKTGEHKTASLNFSELPVSKHFNLRPIDPEYAKHR